MTSFQTSLNFSAIDIAPSINASIIYYRLKKYRPGVTCLYNINREDADAVPSIAKPKCPYTQCSQIIAEQNNGKECHAMKLFILHSEAE
jgi:hypothetical protein